MRFGFTAFLSTQIWDQGQKIVEVVGATLAKTDADHDNQVLKLIEARQPLKDEELAVPATPAISKLQNKKRTNP